MGTPVIPSVDSDTKQFPDGVRARIASNIKDNATPEYAAVASTVRSVNSNTYAPLDSLKEAQLPRATAPRLRRWRQALARVRNQQGDAKLLCIGDSTVAGLGAAVAPIAYGSFPFRLAQLVNSRIPAARGLAIPPTNLSSVADTRWTTGAGWAQADAGFGNHAAFEASGTATEALTFTDNTNANRYDIYAVKQYGGGTLSAVATGGSPVTVDTSTAAGNEGDVVKITVAAAATATSNVVTLTRSAGGAVRVIAIDPFISNVQRVRVGNAGVPTTRAVDHWNTSGSRNALKAYAPDLTIVDLGLNDMENNQSPTQFATAIGNLILDAKASGDVIVMVPPPPRSIAGDAKIALFGQYRAAILSLDVPVADTQARWINGDEATIDGFTLGSTTPTDYLHPNMAGYQDIAQMLVSPIVDV